MYTYSRLIIYLLGASRLALDDFGGQVFTPKKYHRRRMEAMSPWLQVWSGVLSADKLAIVLRQPISIRSVTCADYFMPVPAHPSRSSKAGLRGLPIT